MAGHVERFPVGSDELAVIVLKGEVGRHVSELGHAFDDLAEWRQTAKVAQDKMGRGTVAKPAQGGFDRIVVGKLPT